jgi:hypothetical protein
MRRAGFMVLLVSGMLHAQRLRPEDDVVRKWLTEDKAPAAAAFLDAVVLISDQLPQEERVRLLLLNAVTQAETKNFQRAYRRVRQAQDLLDSLVSPNASRMRSSVELVLHDIRRAEAKESKGATP